MPDFVFVGEKRSAAAIRMGVRWEDGRLAAKTLHEALRAIGLEPARQLFLNLFVDGSGHLVSERVLRRLLRLEAKGASIVAMGQEVQQTLRRIGIGFVPLVHPAARGKIRAREAYQRHVAETLGLGTVVPR